ncbi:GNAT family N-acetyltransferase [Mesorhizobium sp. CN2-181]|uniref:GNAT family N-acetyltransferase n=1 Tax=Mesorhizobium yinganensis TaxID=3157707 RepID=UPI0032B822C9
MTSPIRPRHDLSPAEIDDVENALYDHTRQAIGRTDARGIGFVIEDETGRTIGVAAGFSWGGICDLKQMWIDEACRGHGYGRALLTAFINEASRRDVRRIWVATHDFQAPGFYEKAGFKRMAAFDGWPEGHSNVVLCKTLTTV